MATIRIPHYNRLAPSRWIEDVALMIGPGFHPDTAGNEYVDADGKPSMSKGDALILTLGLAEAFKALGDQVYAIALDVVCSMQFNVGDAVKFHTPNADENPTEVYIVREKTGRDLLVSAVSAQGMAIVPVNRYAASDFIKA